MTFLDVAFIGLAISFTGGLIRVAKGPSLADRAVAADVCLFAVIAALALMGVRKGESAYVDAVLVATLLGFVAAVSLARLIGRWKP